MNPAYTGPVIDPHHHLWDLSLGRHPWLASPVAGQDEMVHGSIASIRRDYGVSEYLRDTSRQNIVATVHVEAGWSDDFPLEETRWLDSLDKRSSVAARYVARVPLSSKNTPRLLELEAANSAVVGIRDIVSWHPDPAKSFVPREDMMSDPRWREGLSNATALGLSFDLMLYPWQMGEALSLAAGFPDTQFVLNHCGSPADRSTDGMALWRKGLAELSSAPNIAIKISNPVAYDPDWTIDSLRMVIDHCIGCFGPERAMFASDLPVAGIHADFNALYDGFRTIATSYSRDEQEALFFSTASRIYRLGLPSSQRSQDSSHV